jgi:hypothetical protein
MGTTLVKSWKELVAVFERDFLDGNWIFRGVNSTVYKLLPKIGRRDAATIDDPGFTIFGRRPTPSARWIPRTNAPLVPATEKELLKRFSLAALPHFPFEPRTELQRLAVAQHYGLPTRLLDWTESPFVAAYFAVIGTPFWRVTGFDTEIKVMGGAPILDYVPGAIHAVRPPDEVSEEEERAPFDILASPVPKLYRPPHLSPRVTVQKAVLTLHSQPSEPWDESKAHKIEISGGIFEEVREGLNMAGINEAALFPDLDGISRHLSWLFDTYRL